MTDDGSYLRRQFKTAWSLTDLHLTGLDTEECLWRPAAQGMHVHRAPDGTWRADWPEHERYDLGPSSIAWLTWHLGFWWSMVLDHSFGAGKLDTRSSDLARHCGRRARMARPTARRVDRSDR